MTEGRKVKEERKERREGRRYNGRGIRSRGTHCLLPKG